MGHSEFITDKLKRIVSQISGKPDKDMPLIPEFVVKGKGVIYCLAPDMRSFNKVTRGIPVYVVVGNYNNSGKCLIYTYPGDIVLIDPEEIEKVGFD
jgi:hypothetical protein